MLKFSVIIPVYNRPDFIGQAIESVLNQNFKNFELIVVDDGSYDETSHIISPYNENITYIYQENQGVSSARNRGIKKSQGEYICFLDSDDLWHKDKLLHHNKFLEEHSEIKIHQTEDIWIRNGKRVNPQKKHLKPSGWIFRESLDLCLISPSSVCIKKDIFHKHGYFDEKLPACEDYDLWLRLTAFYETGLIKEKLITRHSGHEDQLSASFSVMDRFRVYSIFKILQDITIPEELRIIAKKKAGEKLLVLKQGAKKRLRYKKVDLYDDLLEILNTQDYSRIDYESLLDE